MSIAQNTALFSLLGTTYGGNGQTTFALPDLRGRVPVGTGQGPGLANVDLGEVSGTPTVTLTSLNLPAHTHTATFNGASSTMSAATAKASLQLASAGTVLAKTVDSAGTAVPQIYAPSGTATPVALGGLNVAGTVTVNPTGSNQPVSIMQPYLGMNYVICLFGIFPSRVRTVGLNDVLGDQSRSSHSRAPPLIVAQQHLPWHIDARCRRAASTPSFLRERNG